MKNIFYIILISVFSLTLISCSKKDDSASSSSSTSSSSGTSQTLVDSNFCRITKNTSSRNSSLIVNEKKSDTRSSKRTGRVLYVDKSAVAQYETDDYLYLDKFDSNYDIGTSYADGGTEGVNLSDNAPLLGNTFTQELRFYYDPLGDGGRQVLGNVSLKAPSISFHNHGTEIRYGFFTDGVVDKLR